MLFIFRREVIHWRGLRVRGCAVARNGDIVKPAVRLRGDRGGVRRRGGGGGGRWAIHSLLATRGALKIPSAHVNFRPKTLR